jgi:ketosteroid isomerase-like protein
MTDMSAAIRRAYDGFNRRDLAPFLDLVAEDAVMHSQIRGSDIVGRDRVKATFEGLFAAADEWRIEVHDVVANESHVVVLERHNLRLKNGRSLVDSLEAAVFHLDEAGRIKELWPILDTAAWKAALGV